MKIRTRLTLWYAGILCVSTLLIAGVSYKHLLDEQRQSALEHDGGDDEEREAWAQVAKIALWCGLPAALLGLGGGWWLMRKAMSPIETLTSAAEKISDRNLSEPLPRSRNGDELDRLTEVLNHMMTRLDGSFRQIREFTLHASHELKTPLTVMRGETETALRDEAMPVTQRERLLSQLDEIQRLTRIVDGLTLLTKADAGQIALTKEPVALDEIVRDNYEDAKILGATKSIDVCLEKCEEVSIVADRHRLRQLLLNLSDNAIKYNQPNGRVTMSLQAREGAAEFKMTNTGKGIAPSDLPKVFERFFRGDKSHNTSVDGSGLGLSIAQWIVTAHGGVITIDSTPAGLTTVSVRLPVT